MIIGEYRLLSRRIFLLDKEVITIKRKQKILIADDEDYTREGLIDAVDWDKFGIDEIMQAVNGAEAARIAQWFQPDIVISDIRMPQMDGIELAERLLRINPDRRVIFISGYMEIEYLKSAIQLAAVDYI